MECEFLLVTKFICKKPGSNNYGIRSCFLIETNFIDTHTWSSWLTKFITPGRALNCMNMYLQKEKGNLYLPIKMEYTYSFRRPHALRLSRFCPNTFATSTEICTKKIQLDIYSTTGTSKSRSHVTSPLTVGNCILNNSSDHPCQHIENHHQILLYRLEKSALEEHSINLGKLTCLARPKSWPKN